MKSNSNSILNFFKNFNIALIENLVILDLESGEVRSEMETEPIKRIPFIDPLLIIDFLENKQFN